MTRKKQILFIIFSAIDVLVLDIVSKKLAVAYQGSSVEIIGRFFWLDFYQINTGIAFSLPIPRWIQIVSTFLILGILIYNSQDWIFAGKKHPFLKSILFGMILGGALGNLIDRVLQGYVVDFIHLSSIPTFNIADIGIVLGVVGLLLLNWFENRMIPTHRTNPNPSHKSQTK